MDDERKENVPFQNWIRMTATVTAKSFILHVSSVQIRGFEKGTQGPEYEVYRTAQLSQLFGEQGWRSFESGRLPPMCHGFDSRTRRHILVELLLVLFLAVRDFSPGSPVFPSPPKPTLTFQIPIRSGLLSSTLS